MPLSGRHPPPPPPPLAVWPLAPLLYDKVWGGEALAAFGKPIQPGQRVGESWELADLPSTSAGGAGGAEARTRLRATGELANATIHQAIARLGPALMGEVAPTRTGDFPLLVKFLDARDNLSVQVHPSIAYARLHPHTAIKTECWYVLHAQPGAMIHKGVKTGVTREQFQRGIEDGSCLGMMQSVPAVPGDCHLLPSGTVHALGAGVVVAEVQTPSDTTFRVWDWGRARAASGRALHVDEAMACIQFEPARDATRRPAHSPRATLVSTGFFDVDEVHMPAGVPTPIAPAPAQNRPMAIMVLRGRAKVSWGQGDDAGQVDAPLGQTLLCPAGLSAHATCTAQGEDATLLVAIPR